MALPAPPTRGTLKLELASRLGMGAMGTPGGHIARLLNSLLKDAQDQLIEQFGDELRRKVLTEPDWTYAQGQTLYDFPDDCDPYRIKTVACKVEGQYVPMQQGIVFQHYSYDNYQRFPSRYDIRSGTNDVGQLEVWPEPDGPYDGLLEYYRRQTAFDADTDTVSINPRLCLLHAIANGKAHYRQPDAELYANQLDAFLTQLKSRQHGEKRYTGRTARARHMELQRHASPPRNRIVMADGSVIVTEFGVDI